MKQQNWLYQVSFQRDKFLRQKWMSNNFDVYYLKRIPLETFEIFLSHFMSVTKFSFDCINLFQTQMKRQWTFNINLFNLKFLISEEFPPFELRLHSTVPEARSVRFLSERFSSRTEPDFRDSMTRDSSILRVRDETFGRLWIGGAPESLKEFFAPSTYTWITRTLPLGNSEILILDNFQHNLSLMLISDL